MHPRGGMQWAPLRTPSPPLQMRGEPASCHGRLQALPARLPCSLLPSEFPLFAPSLAPMTKMGALGSPPEGVFLLLILVFSHSEGAQPCEPRGQWAAGQMAAEVRGWRVGG